MCVSELHFVKAQGNLERLAEWWLSLPLAIFNVILPLAVQGPAMCWVCWSLCGDQWDLQNSQHTAEVTQADPSQLGKVCWSWFRPLNRLNQMEPALTEMRLPLQFWQNTPQCQLSWGKLVTACQKSSYTRLSQTGFSLENFTRLLLAISSVL